MQKLIYETLCGGHKDRYIMGVKESVNWIPMSWNGGPKESGEYLVSDGKGKVFKLYYAHSREKCRDLFDIMVDGYNTYANDANDNSFNRDELIDILYKGFRIWYDIEHVNLEDGWYDTYYTFYTGNDVPKYYLESQLQGPIDGDLESYKEILVDEDLNIITNREEEES